MDIGKIIRLRVFLVLLGLLAILWSVLCVSSIRTNLGIKKPKEITGKDSADILIKKKIQYKIALEKQLKESTAKNVYERDE